MKKFLSLLCVLIGLSACSTNSVNCDNCLPYERAYTVSQPVEVVYRKTTYRTVYEPKTYKETTLERRPYRFNNCLETSSRNICQ